MLCRETFSVTLYIQEAVREDTCFIEAVEGSGKKQDKVPKASKYLKY